MSGINTGYRRVVRALRIVKEREYRGPYYGLVQTGHHLNIEIPRGWSLTAIATCQCGSWSMEYRSPISDSTALAVARAHAAHIRRVQDEEVQEEKPARVSPLANAE